MRRRGVADAAPDWPAHPVFADYFDGRRALGHRVQLQLGPGAHGPTLDLILPEGAALGWALEDMRAIPDQAEAAELILTARQSPLARLVIRDRAAMSALRARTSSLNRALPATGRGRIFGWAVAACASVALIVFVLVPVMADQLAEFLPYEGEQALGDATFEQIRDALSESGLDPVPICDDPAGLAALGRLQARLEEGIDLPYPLRIHVLDHELVNAFALPGGHVAIFRGLIDAAQSPDEVAAVLGHEIGHVAHRDPTRGALRSAGSIGVLGLLFGDFAGGAAVLFLVERLVDATYSQQAEADADRFAHDLLLGGGMSPAALATFFERLQAEQGGENALVAHFMAHPGLGDRIAAAREAAKGLTGPLRPSLGEQDWQDLRHICRQAG